MAAKAKAKPKGKTMWLVVMLVAAAAVGYWYWKKRQVAAAMPLYTATPQTTDNPYGGISYGASGSGVGINPTVPYGANTAYTGTGMVNPPTAQMPIAVGNGGNPLIPLETPATVGVGASSAAHGGTAAPH